MWSFWSQPECCVTLWQVMAVVYNESESLELLDSGVSDSQLHVECLIFKIRLRRSLPTRSPNETTLPTGCKISTDRTTGPSSKYYCDAKNTFFTEVTGLFIYSTCKLLDRSSWRQFYKRTRCVCVWLKRLIIRGRKKWPFEVVFLRDMVTAQILWCQYFISLRKAVISVVYQPDY